MFVIVIFGIIILISQNIRKDDNELLYKKIKNKAIKSIITNKSVDFRNHGATYIVYGKDSLPTHTGWDEKINIGDSIIKDKNSLILKIKNDVKIENLNYEANSQEILSTNF